MDVKNRIIFNRAIINKLLYLIEKYPEQRFGQLLINSGILELFYIDGDNCYYIKDCFNEESEITFKKINKVVSDQPLDFNL